MGNPKERKECPICGKTLYDRSTWNRHMRIHTGKQIQHFFFTIFTWLCRHWLCNIYKKISFFLSLPLFQVKNPILVAFAVDVSEPITTSSATRRNVRIDTPGLSCNPPPRTARALCPAWSTDNVRPPPIASNNLNTAVKSIQLTHFFLMPIKSLSKYDPVRDLVLNLIIRVDINNFCQTSKFASMDLVL